MMKSRFLLSTLFVSSLALLGTSTPAAAQTAGSSCTNAGAIQLNADSTAMYFCLKQNGSLVWSNDSVWQAPSGASSTVFTDRAVGIGTTTPSASLDIAGNFRVKDTSRTGVAMAFANTTSQSNAWGCCQQGAYFMLQSQKNGLDNVWLALGNSEWSANDGFYEMYNQSANALQFVPLGAKTPSIDIDGTGNVGIGTSSPGTTLEVDGHTNLVTTDGSSPLNIVVNGSSGANGGIQIWQSNSGGWDSAAEGLGLFVNQQTGDWNPLVQAGDDLIVFRGQNKGDLYASGQGLVIGPWAKSAYGIRISGQGNVGIDVRDPDPQYMLDIGAINTNNPNNGNSYNWGNASVRSNGVFVSENYDAQYDTIDPATRLVYQLIGTYHGFDPDTVYVAAYNAGDGDPRTVTQNGVAQKIGNAKAVSFGQQGSMVVDLTTNYVSMKGGYGSADAYFVSNNSGACSGCNGDLYVTGGSDNSWGIYHDPANGGSAPGENNRAMLFDMSNDGGANVTIYGKLSATLTSDERLKKNVQDVAGGEGLKALGKLRPVTFEWKNPAQHKKGTDIGFIAQEVQKVFPDWVHELYAANDDKKLVDKDGKELAIDQFPPGFDALVVSAIKDLKAANDAQAVEIKALKDEVEALKAGKK